MRTALLIMLLLPAACGFSPVVTHVEPRLDLPRSTVGQGRPLLLTVLDERADKSIGQRQQGLVRGARIELDEPLDLTVRRALAAALARQGFRLVEGEAAGLSDAARLEIRIEDFGYRPSGGAVGARVVTRASLAARASGSGDYGRTYELEDEDRMTLASSEHFSAARLSSLLGETLRRLVTDPRLLAALAPPPAG